MSGVSTILRLFASALALTALVGFWCLPAQAYPARTASGQDQQENQSELALAALLEGTGPLAIAGTEFDRPALLRVYRARHYQPIWMGNEGAALDLSNALAGAGVEGIDPHAVAADIAAATLGDPTMAPAARETALTGLFIRYTSALAQGQIDPQATDPDWVLARPSFDPAPLLERIARGASIRSVVAGLTPSQPAYQQLRSALARYERIAAKGDWPLVPALSGEGPRRSQAAFAIMRQRLAMEGDNDADLLKAVQRFQARHGIDADGTVGPATLEALNISAAARAVQLRLALERYREMPRDWPATRLAVNIPSATLVLYRENKVVLTSRVVVGDRGHPTPILGSAIGSILFNPPWTVPASIVRKEIQPRLAKDPGYLARNHFQLLGRGDGSSDGIDWSNTDILANGWQLQQQPGPWNALGTLMLDFPSPFSVYLHDTPGRSAFARSDRSLSHGCVRVEQVTALAGELLGPEGSPEAIQKIVAGQQTQRHALKKAMPIYLMYLTAFVDDDGALQFRDDPYGVDARLAAALKDAKGPDQPRVALRAAR
ncbi:MAG TPA: L,D-transpeptidase family protein [Dongiaceae bacterium]